MLDPLQWNLYLGLYATENCVRVLDDHELSLISLELRVVFESFAAESCLRVRPILCTAGSIGCATALPMGVAPEATFDL